MAGARQRPETASDAGFTTEQLLQSEVLSRGGLPFGSPQDKLSPIEVSSMLPAACAESSARHHFKKWANHSRLLDALLSVGFPDMASSRAVLEAMWSMGILPFLCGVFDSVSSADVLSAMWCLVLLQEASTEVDSAPEIMDTHMTGLLDTHLSEDMPPAGLASTQDDIFASADSALLPGSATSGALVHQLGSAILQVGQRSLQPTSGRSRPGVAQLRCQGLLIALIVCISLAEPSCGWGKWAGSLHFGALVADCARIPTSHECCEACQ